MSKPKPIDPEKRAAKAERRKRRREAEARGVQMLPRRARPAAQMDHGSNPKGARHAREGERAMHRERGEKSMIPTLDELRERRVPLDGQVLARTDFQSTDYDGNDHEGVADIERANLITSIVDTGSFSHLGGACATHKVVIDVDLPVSLVASTTPGHFHLFIDKAMSWEAYRALLEALAVAGIVEPGYVAAALHRGHTAVRLPWVRKPALVPVPVDPADCTHGADCEIHSDVSAPHNYDPPRCTCVGLAHRNECPQWVLPH